MVLAREGSGKPEFPEGKFPSFRKEFEQNSGDLAFHFHKVSLAAVPKVGRQKQKKRDKLDHQLRLSQAAQTLDQSGL